MILRLLIALTLTFCFVSPALAQREKLKAGDKAPALDIEKWVAGDPVKLGQNEIIFLFFIESLEKEGRFVMELLSYMQDNLAEEGARLAVVSSEEEEDLERFVKKNRKEIRFSLGFDKRAKTKNEWLTAAKIKSEEAVFVVGRDDKVMFIGGSPDTKTAQAQGKQFAELVGRIARGRYNPALEPAAEARLTEAERSRKIKNWKIAEKLYDDVLKMDKSVFADVALRKFELKLVDQNNPDLAYAYVNGLIEEDYRSDVQFLIDLAEKIATDPLIPDASRRYDVALKAANMALESAYPVVKYRVMAVIAKVSHRAGDNAKAVEFQRQAWFQAAPRVKTAYKHTLDTYDAAYRRAGAGTPLVAAEITNPNARSGGGNPEGGGDKPEKPVGAEKPGGDPEKSPPSPTPDPENPDLDGV